MPRGASPLGDWDQDRYDATQVTGSAAPHRWNVQTCGESRPTLESEEKAGIMVVYW